MSDKEIERTQKRFTIKEETFEHLKDYAYENNIPYASVSRALESIVDEYIKNKNNNFKLNYVIEQVSNEVNKSVQIAIKESISDEINKVRLGTNNVDRNTQILIELLQGYMQAENIKGIFTTNMNTPEFLKQTKKVVHERITNQKQKKDSK